MKQVTDSEDGEIGDGNVVMNGGGVDGGVSRVSEGDDDPESSDTNEISEGVREMIERKRADREETLATLSGANETEDGAWGGAIVLAEVGTPLAGKAATFLLRGPDDPKGNATGRGECRSASRTGEDADIGSSTACEIAQGFSDWIVGG